MGLIHNTKFICLQRSTRASSLYRHLPVTALAFTLATAVGPSSVEAAKFPRPIAESSLDLSKIESSGVVKERQTSEGGLQQQDLRSSAQAPVAEPVAAKPPQVTYEDGQLTVIAENSSLSDVLKALREALGADIDLRASVGDQHIWVHLGPGPASRVLRDLLDSTEFNYAIQASESDPDGIRSVLLTPRSKSAGSETAGSPEKAAIRRMPRTGTGADAANVTESEDPSAEPAAAVDPSQAASPPASPPAGPVNASSASLQNAPGSSALRPSVPTDPEQMIQQLQSMYQQRRQLQIQQNQKAAGQN